MNQGTWMQEGKRKAAGPGKNAFFCGILLVLFIFAVAFTATAQTWNQLSPVGGPPSARINVGVSYDPTTNTMIIVGGCGGPNTSVTCPILNDVWVLANADGLGGTPTWTQLSPSGTPPSPRDSATTVYDPTTNSVILFAGNPNEGGSCGAVNDVWLLSNANGSGGTPQWTQLNPIGGPPHTRRGHTAVYDTTNNRMIIFGGDDVCGSVFNDVWVLENANATAGKPTWVQLSPVGGPPADRGSHTAVYDPTTNRMTIFGGCCPQLNDAWVLENANGLGGTLTWVQLSPTGGPPPGRDSHTAVFDSAANQMTIFGGQDQLGIVNDVWVLSHANGLGGRKTAWSQLSPTGGPPAARRNHAAVLNPSSDRMTIFGGVTATPTCCSALNDTWVLKLHSHLRTALFAYTGNLGSDNISAYRVNPATGALTQINGSPYTAGPGAYIPVADPTGQFLYVPNLRSTTISAYTINATTGALTEITGSPFAAGRGPIVTVHPNGKFLYASNSGDTTISAYTINNTTGALTPIQGSPFSAGTGPAPVSINPTAQFAYTGNGGSNDVSGYTIDPGTGALAPTPNSPYPAALGAFYSVIDLTGRFLYVVNQDGGSISAYTIDLNTGALTLIQGSPFPAGTSPIGPTLHPKGQFLYVANFASANISAYTINSTTGALTPIQGSPFPAAPLPPQVAIDPKGQFAYVSDSRTVSTGISAYTINSTTGALTPITGSPFPAGARPAPITIDPTSRFLYVVNRNSANISAYTINSTTGALTPIQGSPFPAGMTPAFVTLTAGP